MKDRLSDLKANGGEYDDNDDMALPMDGNSKFMEGTFSEVSRLSTKAIVQKAVQTRESEHSAAENLQSRRKTVRFPYFFLQIFLCNKIAYSVLLCIPL